MQRRTMIGPIPPVERVDMSVAFTPVFDATSGRVFVQSAELRRADGTQLAPLGVDCGPVDVPRHDRQRHEAAMAEVVRLGIGVPVVIPAIATDPVALRSTLQPLLWRADGSDIPFENIVLNLEAVPGADQVAGCAQMCRELGLRSALSGLGGAGTPLGQLADNLPDMVFLDAALACGVDVDPARRTVMRSLVYMAENLGARLVATGVRSSDDLGRLFDLGVRLMQGPYLARPEIGGIRTVPEHAVAAISDGDAFDFGLSA